MTGDDIIFSYTRRQAIEDGVLVDMTQGELGELLREAGFKLHTAMTATGNQRVPCALNMLIIRMMRASTGGFMAFTGVFRRPFRHVRPSCRAGWQRGSRPIRIFSRHGTATA